MLEFDSEKMGKRIKELRIERGLTQQALGTKVGVLQNTLAEYESGKAKPSYKVLINLAVELNTSTDYLLGLKDWE